MSRSSLVDLLKQHAATRPGALAVRAVWPAAGPALTYGELDRQVQCLAKNLRPHLAVGAVVLLCLPNEPAYTIALLGCLASGATVFPAPTDASAAELWTSARRSGAAAIIAGEKTLAAMSAGSASLLPLPALGATGRAMLLRPKDPAAAGSGPAVLLQSSGTTAEPKLVRRDAASLDAVAANMVAAVGFGPDDTVLAAVPLCHSYGLEHGLLAPLAAGSAVHLCDGFDVSLALRELGGGTITIFPGVPFMFEMLAGADTAALRFPSLRRAYAAGGPLPRGVFDAFLSRFGARVSQLYGATEIGSVTFNDPDAPAFDPASVGRPMHDVDVRILNPGEPDPSRPLGDTLEGEVAVRAPSMLSGYVDSEPPPLLAGFFLTGDLGRTENGSLAITGRIKLLIDVGGRKVNPLEVEAVLRGHPAVGECAVVPVRVSQTLNRLKAIVTPRQPGATIPPGELRKFARERLTAYKVPRVFEVHESLPKSAAGKVLRHLLNS